MKSTLKEKIFGIIGFIGSVLTIIGFVCEHFKITIPKIIFPEIKIDFEYFFAINGVYTLILSLLIFFISLFTGYKTKKYNAKTSEKYKNIINYFKLILFDKKTLSYEFLSYLIKEIYPYKNKSKINLVFKRSVDNAVLYDTSNYDEWAHNKSFRIMHLNSFLHKKRYDWRATAKYFEKREIHVHIGDNPNNYISLIIYSNNKATITKRKKKMMKPFLDSITIYMYVILAQQNDWKHVVQE